MNSQETQNLKTEVARLKQMLQDTGSRGDNEMEQWRKVVEQEKVRADQAEKAAAELHKRVQLMEKQLQQQLQQMTNLQKQNQQNQQNTQQAQQIQNSNAQATKEIDQLKKDLQAANVERERFQAQLEMLVQELEKSQVVKLYILITLFSLNLTLPGKLSPDLYYFQLNI